MGLIGDWTAKGMAALAGGARTVVEWLSGRARDLEGDKKTLDLRVNEQSRTIDAQNAEILKKTESYRELQSENEALKAELHAALEEMLAERGIKGEQAFTMLGLLDLRSGKLDSEKVRKLLASLQVQLTLLNLLENRLRDEAGVLRAGGRDDVVDALHLRQISEGLELLGEKFVHLHLPNAPLLANRACFDQVFAPCFESAALHRLFRADKVASTYFLQDRNLSALRNLLGMLAHLVEFMMLGVGARAVIPDLLARLSSGAKQQFGAEAGLRRLPEVKSMVANLAGPGQDTVVDIFEIGIEADYTTFPPIAVTWSAAEWMQ